MKRIALVVVLLALSVESWAASPWSGVWVQRDATTHVRLTMTLEEVGSGWKITYRIPVPNGQAGAATSVMTIETALDGKDAPCLVNGKPSSQTMGIRKLDDRHASTVLKVDGKQTGISKSELSADGKVIKSENELTDSAPNGAAGEKVEYWDKQ